MHRLRVALAAMAAVLVIAPSLAIASRGQQPTGSASCSVSGNVVNAVGLPTDEVINFLVTDGSGTSGWVLGYTDDGTWSVTVPAPRGPTAYEFVSRTWGRTAANTESSRAVDVPVYRERQPWPGARLPLLPPRR